MLTILIKQYRQSIFKYKNAFRTECSIKGLSCLLNITSFLYFFISITFINMDAYKAISTQNKIVQLHQNSNTVYAATQVQNHNDMLIALLANHERDVPNYIQRRKMESIKIQYIITYTYT